MEREESSEKNKERSQKRTGRKCIGREKGGRKNKVN